MTTAHMGPRRATANRHMRPDVALDDFDLATTIDPVILTPALEGQFEDSATLVFRTRARVPPRHPPHARATVRRDREGTTAIEPRRARIGVWLAAVGVGCGLVVAVHVHLAARRPEIGEVRYAMPQVAAPPERREPVHGVEASDLSSVTAELSDEHHHDSNIIPPDAASIELASTYGGYPHPHVPPAHGGDLHPHAPPEHELDPHPQPYDPGPQPSVEHVGDHLGPPPSTASEPAPDAAAPPGQALAAEPSEPTP